MLCSYKEGKKREGERRGRGVAIACTNRKITLSKNDSYTRWKTDRFPSFPRTKVHDSIVRYSMFLTRSFASRFGIISQMKYLRVEISSSQTEVIKMLRLIHESNIYISIRRN